jgi:hypothetical protein
MSGSADAMRAIMDRLIETTKRKAEAKGKSIFKPPKKEPKKKKPKPPSLH